MVVIYSVPHDVPWGYIHCTANLSWLLQALNKAVTALSSAFQTLNKAVTALYTNKAAARYKAVTFTTHTTAFYRAPYCIQIRLVLR